VLQTQEYAPTVFVHEASGEHSLSAVLAHSSTSVHDVPDPSYPALHVQRKVPSAFVHAAFASQSSVPTAHSSTSVHVPPKPGAT
jgi:hypothetical protein